MSMKSKEKAPSPEKPKQNPKMGSSFQKVRFNVKAKRGWEKANDLF